MGYKIKTHSGASKRFKKTGSSVKVEVQTETIYLQNRRLKERDIIEVSTR